MIHLQLLPSPLTSSIPSIPKSKRKPESEPVRIQSYSENAQLPVGKDSGLKFHEKVLYLKSRNINPIKALHINPNLRTASLSSLQSIERYLSSKGIDDPSAIGRILDMYPQLLTADPFLEIEPVFDFLLDEVEIPDWDISRTIIRCPRLLVSDVESRLKPTLHFLRNLGFVGHFKITAQNTVLLVSDVEYTLIPKINYLIGLGLEYDEVVNMVLRSPGLLTFSIEKNFKPKMEYFLKEMKGELEELKRFPQYFSYSMDRKIKPRYQMLMEHGFSMALSEMLKVSDGEFRARLIEMQLRSVEDKKLQHAIYQKR